MREWIKNIGIDLAVIYGGFTTIWRLVAGPIVLILVVRYFTPTLQGYYYTFISVVTLRVFVELGLGNVIIQFASHEWSKLSMDSQGQITGDADALARLISIGQIAFRWYFVGGVLFAIGLCLGGYIFFSKSVTDGVEWMAPWFMLSVLMGLNFWLFPAFFLLEGCNQVSQVYLYRLSLGIVSSFSVAAAIMLGAGLWTVALSVLVEICWSVAFLGWRCRRFYKLFASPVTGPRISWWGEVWQMQWRLALASVFGYFISSFMTPIMFHYYGPIVAGQMGMTWGLINTLSGITAMLTATKAPQFGMLIAGRDYKNLDRQFFRIATTSIILMVSGAFALWLGVYGLNVLEIRFAARLLPPLPTGLFLLGQIAMFAGQPFAVYLRAHKKEPYLTLSIVSGALMGFFTWFLGSRYAATGAALGYLAVSSLVNLPFGFLIWFRCKAAWQSNVP